MKIIILFLFSLFALIGGIVLINIALNSFYPPIKIDLWADFILALGIDLLTVKVRL